MQLCSQNISKIITAMSFKLGQLEEDIAKIIWWKVHEIIFDAINLCKLGHRKHAISKTITARSFKLV